MPRTARIAFPSMVYHVISRGNNREWVFNEREDFEKYLEICGRYKDKFGFKLYHWVLMSNHIHLVMETTEESSLSKIMQGMNLAYTIWFNRKNGKVGHLWQDRFKSALVEKDNYLLECGRYVERNPLRARLVKDPREYPWSSYRVYAYGKADGVTDRHATYEAMGKEDRARRKAYREYVCCNRDKEEREIRERMARGVIGAEVFQQHIEKRVMEFSRPKRGRPRK
ncbi:MAG: transposase [Deltaproteobacteria bacterium]|nr:transposase [Deltaproteobacteria bacterium]